MFKVDLEIDVSDHRRNLCFKLMNIEIDFFQIDIKINVEIDLLNRHQINVSNQRQN